VKVTIPEIEGFNLIQAVQGPSIWKAIHSKNVTDGGEFMLEKGEQFLTLIAQFDGIETADLRLNLILREE